jgi:putative oxidoreductase
VYPQAWPTHLQWAAMMLVLLCRGAGTFSLDHLLLRRFVSKQQLPASGGVHVPRAS